MASLTCLVGFKCFVNETLLIDRIAVSLSAFDVCSQCARCSQPCTFNLWSTDRVFLNSAIFAFKLVAFRIPLVNTTVLLLSREAFRRGCLRRQISSNVSQEEEIRSILPLTLFPILIGSFLTGLTAFYISIIFSQSGMENWDVVIEHGGFVSD